MKRLLLIALCCYLSARVVAQTTPQTITVKGTAIDSTSNQPLGYVTVSLLNPKTKQSVRGGLTKEDGTFALQCTLGREYLLSLVSVGYQDKLIKVTAKGSEVNLGRIMISVSKNQLKEISITAVKPVVKQEIDRISYDVQADPETKTQSVLDMLRKVPLVTVDASDNIQLKGESNYKILINGKPSSLVANNPSDIFKSMPASSIQKIEVITTPPAKYDAEGLAGIINIITNKKIDQGYNGNINVSNNSIWGPRAGLNFTVKQGKLGISNYTGFGDQITQHRSSRNSLQTFGDDPTLLQQSSASTNSGKSFYTSTEISYEIDSLNLITGSIDFNHWSGNSEFDQLSDLYDASGTLTQHYQLKNTANNTSKGFDFGFNYQLGFKDSKERLLTFSYKYSNFPADGTNMNTIFDRFNYGQPGYLQQNDKGTREQTVQADYVHPIKQLKIEGGIKAILRDNTSNFGTSDFIDSTQMYVDDPTNTDNFKYNQDIYSVYNTYQYNYNNWGIKAGARFETTDINANFISAGTNLDRDYNNFVPSISIQRKLKDGTSFNFGFTNRIQRPDINLLNPFVNQTNPKFISSGNPDLVPVVSHNLELNFSKFSKGSFNLGVSYAFSNNTIQSITTLKDTVSSTTFENLGTSKNLGFNASINYPFTKDLNFNLNARLANTWLRGYYDGELYSNDGLQGNAFAYLGYRLSETWRAGANAGYSSPYISLQGRGNSNFFASISTSKDVLDKKGSVFVNVSNPFAKDRNYDSTTRDPDFYQTNESTSPYRSFSVGFNYRFGKLKSEIKKNQKNIDNDDKGIEKSSN